MRPNVVRPVLQCVFEADKKRWVAQWTIDAVRILAQILHAWYMRAQDESDSRDYKSRNRVMTIGEPGEK